MNVTLPYFNDIYKMHWIAQPFAVVCNFFLTLMYLLLIVVLFAIYAVGAVGVFIVSLPVIFAALVVALCGINRVEKHVKQFRAPCGSTPSAWDGEIN